MLIKIIAKNEKGFEALNKLSKEKTMGVAKKEIIALEPFTLEIHIKGVGKFWKFLKGNPQIDTMVYTTWMDILKKYGANDGDVEIKAV